MNLGKDLPRKELRSSEVCARSAINIDINSNPFEGEFSAINNDY